MIFWDSYTFLVAREASLSTALLRVGQSAAVAAQ